MVDLNKIIMIMIALLIITAIAVSVTAKEPLPPKEPPFGVKQLSVSNYLKEAYKITPTKIILETKKGDPLICEECIEFELTEKASTYLKAVKVYEGKKVYTWITTKIKYEAITK